MISCILISCWHVQGPIERCLPPTHLQLSVISTCGTEYNTSWCPKHHFIVRGHCWFHRSMGTSNIFHDFLRWFAFPMAKRNHIVIHLAIRSYLWVVFYFCRFRVILHPSQVLIVRELSGTDISSLGQVGSNFYEVLIKRFSFQSLATTRTLCLAAIRKTHSGISRGGWT